MKRLLILLICLFPVTVFAEWIPTGTHQWRNEKGDIHVAMGMRHRPLNYQKSDGSWAAIDPDWKVVNDTIYKVNAGVYHSYAMDNGYCYYVRPRNGVRHAIGAKLTRLIKFDKSDSSFVTLAVADYSGEPDVEGRFLTYHPIPGLTRKVEYDNIILNDRVTFSQALRDSLAQLGPWNNHLIGTVTRIDIDSLNLDWHSKAGKFILNNAGLMTDTTITLEVNDTAVVWLHPQWVHGDTVQTSPETPMGDIRVIKRVVVIEGQPFIVELFDPIAANQLPSGDIWHNLTFGNSGNGASTLSLETYIISGFGSGGSYWHCDDAGAQAESLTARVVVAWETFDMQFMLCENNGEAHHDTLGRTEEVSLTCADASCGAKWVGAAFPSPITLDQADGEYVAAFWSETHTGGGENCEIMFSLTSGTADSCKLQTSQNYNNWGSPMGGNFYDYEGPQAYCYYTIPSSGQIIIIGWNMDFLHDTLEQFAGVKYQMEQ